MLERGLTEHDGHIQVHMVDNALWVEALYFMHCSEFASGFDKVGSKFLEDPLQPLRVGSL